MTCALVPAATGSAAAVTPETPAGLAQRAIGGQLSCQKLTSAQAGLIGRYMMSRMVGRGGGLDVTATHMQSLFGKAGLEQAYQFMGRRLAGCSTGDGPQAFGAMMGMMGGGMMGASYGYGTGGYGSNSYAPGYMMGGRHGPGMMGGYPYQSTGGSGLSAGAIVGIVLGGIAVLGLAVFAGTGLARRSARPPQAHGS